MKRKKQILIIAIALFSIGVLKATNYTSNGSISLFCDNDYDYESHTVNISGAEVIKVTISMSLCAYSQVSDGYGYLDTYISGNSSNTCYLSEWLESYYPDESFYYQTFYIPNNVTIELCGDMWNYWGDIWVSFEKVNITASSLLPNATQWLFDADANNYYIAHDNSEYNLKLYDKTQPALAVSKDGKLGIGMQASNQLDIAGVTRFSVNTSTSIYTKFGNFQSSSYVPSLESMGSVQVVLDNNNNDNDTKMFDIRKNSTTGTVLMRVEENGNVGIGTTTPSTKLHVNGKGKFEDNLYVNGILRAEEVIIEMPNGDWPDYVFTDTYNLLPLDAVEKHISDKGHLPSIPSAKEVREEGVSVGEMNKLLLQKVEELTLYIIEQEKRIKSLESKVK